MDYLVLAIIIFTIILAVLLFTRKSKKVIEHIRSNWSKVKAETFYFERIRSYADAVTDHSFHRLTSQTLEDIDFDGIFAIIDRTTSRIGQQYLYKKLMEPTNTPEDPAQHLIDLFTDNVSLREEVQVELSKLNNTDAYNIPSLMRSQDLEKPGWLNWLMVNVIVMTGLLVMSVFYPILLIVLIVPFAVNMIIHYWNKGNAFQYISSIPQLNLMITIAGSLSKKDESLRSAVVDDSIFRLKSLRRKTALLSFDKSGSVQAELNQLANYLVEFIKAFFLIEVFVLFKIVKELENQRQSIINLFNYIGNIDASISVVALRAGDLTTCTPMFVPHGKDIQAINIYHPLIDNCQPNSIVLDGRSILITGSNMSGKSTFLRTFTINSILAQTIYTCFADKFVSPVLKQFTSIRIDDSLLEGKSYYFQEVSVIGSLIEEAMSTQQNLFVLDEVFKGTNTVERVAAAKAVLSYLNKGNNIVIVSTHDIELSEMLEEAYDLYHFTETIEDNELHFDFRIKPGQLTTRNAIRILELSQYPLEITDEARRISERRADRGG